jgi:hypothetical protein
VAQLIHHCGVSLNMNFEAHGSSAYSSRVPYGMATCFGYTSSNLTSRSGYSNGEWYNLIASDIDAGKPIYYSFQSATDGHAVVCDGYRNGNEIHLNLGWGGNDTAWYSMDSISTSNGDFNFNHAAVFGITPPSSGGLSAPVLNSEPAITPGTANTISWSAVQSAPVPAANAGASSAFQAQHQRLATVLEPTSAPGLSQTQPQANGSLSLQTEACQPATASVAAEAGKHSEATMAPNPTPPSPHRVQLVCGPVVAPTSSAGDTPTVEDLALRDFSPQARFQPANRTLPTNAAVRWLPSLPVQTDGEPPVTSWNTLLSDSFEGGFPGATWQVSGSPGWGRTTYSSHSGSYSVWCAGSSLSASGGAYANNMNAWMIYGPFSLTDATSANLSFYFRNYSETNCDYFECMASTDGQHFFGTQWTGNGNNWQN